MKKLKYLGTTVANDNKLDAKLEVRISNASKSVWQNKDSIIKTKRAVYRAIVLSALLYGVESWVLVV